MRFEQVGQSFVAEVMDVDLGRISDSEFRVLYKAWLEFGVLRIRGQSLNDGELQRFSNRFGPLEEIPYGKISEEEKQKIKNRYVTVISNIEVDGKPIGGLGNKEATWHSDMTYIEDPPPASILMSLEVPELGGDTHFSDQKAAYLSLPNELVSRIENLSIKHNAAHTSVGDLRRVLIRSKIREKRRGHSSNRQDHDETKRKCCIWAAESWLMWWALPLKKASSYSMRFGVTRLCLRMCGLSNGK